MATEKGREKKAGDLAWVGASAERVDALAKVKGRAVYVDDLKFPGMLYGKVLRSRYPHARVLRIDVSRAARLPGVKGVVTGEDLPFLHGESIIDEPFLAREKVRYAGEGVAAVAAVDLETAELALSLISVEYEELPALFDPLESAQPGATLIHEDLLTYSRAGSIHPLAGMNVCNHFQLQKGNVEKGFAEADEIFVDTFTTQMQQHATIESHGAVCLIDDQANVTLWANNDSPYRCRKEIATAFKLPFHRVRVVVPTLGGNFGGKGGLKAEACAVALAWKVRNRPIKVMYTREEEFCSAIVRHPAVITLKTGVKKDGTILAREVKIYYATGAYAEKGPTITISGGISGAGPYRIPNVKIDAYCVYTNRQTAGAMRGYGGSQVAWAYESQMDIIARKLGLDPLELRLRHVYGEGDVHTNGQKIHSHGLKECLAKVAESMAWKKEPLGKDRGRGMACMEGACKTPFGSAAFVKVNEDGTVDILSSTTDVGQGSDTVFCQIAAEELGVSLEQVRKAAPDTAVTPFDASTTSSRSTFHMGQAVKMAAADAREQIMAMAARLLKAEAAGLAIREGRVYHREAPEQAVPIARVLSEHYGSSGTVLGRGYYFPPVDGPVEYFSVSTAFWLLGCQGVEVEVDRKTGKVTILKVFAAHDVGKAIHPESCVGQIQGGIVMGMGYALLEEMVLKGGQVLNPSFLTYKVPTALDAPEMAPLVVECAQANGPYGAKGMGEKTNVPTPPAIANAIFDAVGVRIKDLPITPAKVLEALQKIDTERQRHKDALCP